MLPISDLAKTLVEIESIKKVPLYLVRPKIVEKKRPALIVLHEWWGLNQQIKEAADRYATLGYLVVAPSFYGGIVATTGEEGRRFSASVPPPIASQMIGSVVDFLNNTNLVDSAKLGLVGYCAGGRHALNYISESNEVAAAVIFYASGLPNENQLAKIRAPMMIIYGDRDENIGIDKVRELDATLKRLNKNAKVIVYPDAPHAFCNEMHPRNYRPHFAKDAFEKATAFLAEHLA